MLQFTPGSVATLYANFLGVGGEESTNIVNPKITIRHVDSSGTLITDVNEQPLTLATETLYFFKWSIPATADLGEYTVEYEAVVNGEPAEANETVQIKAATDSSTGVTACDNYTTVEKVADYLGVDSSSIKGLWLEWATAYIETFTCQRFCPTTVTEKYDIRDHNQEILMLDHYPILEVVELKDDNDVVPASDYLVYEDEGFIKFADEFTGTEINLLQPGPFTFGRQRVEITYKYGFNNVPKEIEWVATVLTASIASTALKQSGTLSVGEVIEEKIGEYTRKKAEEQSDEISFDFDVKSGQEINGRLEEDVFSAKNILRMYRDRKMRSV